MADVVQFPGKQGGAGGGDSEGPMLEPRVARLEDDMRDVKTILRAIEARLTAIEVSIGDIKGRLGGFDSRFAALPTTWTILTITFTTWAIGSGILIFALNVLRK